ncbi:MAG: dATP/dGTP diphosphohydrolase domain-containing protein [Patescibacteria group bacterium]|jgi:hypothetical protein
MRARVIYNMKDRTTYQFDVEGDDQRAWLRAGEKELVAVLVERNRVGTTGAIIDTFQTIPEAAGPGQDKQDGIAIRSTLQKVRLDLLPTAPLAMVARVFTFGAYNYGDQNWRGGFAWSRCIGAAKRHIMKWEMGQDADEESNLNHLAHAVANLLFLLEFQLLGLGTDDRVKYDPKLIVELLASFPVDDNR